MKDSIRAFIIDELLDGKAVEDDDEMLISGLLDSLGVMRLVAHLESSAGVTIPPDQIVIEHFCTIDAIASYLDSITGAGGDAEGHGPGAAT